MVSSSGPAMRPIGQPFVPAISELPMKPVPRSRPTRSAVAMKTLLVCAAVIVR